MSAELAISKEIAPPFTRHRRRGPSDHLRDALQRLGEGQPLILHHRERSWASITFSGTRHTLTLLFTGTKAVAAGERFIDALPDHEFAIPGQLVADAAVTSVDHALLPTPRMKVQVEVLILEDA